MMLPKKPKIPIKEFIDLTKKPIIEKPPVEQQHEIAARKILAKQKRLEDMRNGIELTQETPQQIPFNKSELRAKNKNFASQSWNPFEDVN